MDLYPIRILRKFRYANYHKVTFLLLSGLAALALGNSSCTDEVLPSQNPNSSFGNGNLTAIDLPGVFGIKLSANDVSETRADNMTPDGLPFEDGSTTEYKLATPDRSNGEYYHYLLLYNNSASTPLIFPINDEWTNTADPVIYNNLTLTISRAFTNGVQGELNNNNVLDSFDSPSAFADYIAGMEGYVLLNFKLIDGDNPNYQMVDGESVSQIDGDNTLQKLSKLTKKQLEENLQMLDYKISASQTTTNSSGVATTTPGTFFTMSNAVYSDLTNKVIGVEMDNARIYQTEEEALQNPCLQVWVERLAAKVTVNFDFTKLAQAKFSTYYDSDITEVEKDPETGLPIISTTVERVLMGDGTGITFSEEQGYHINHEPLNVKIKIKGFGISNEEKKMRLFKDINPVLSVSDFNWNDRSNHRSYWARDNHYELEKVNTLLFPKVKGYPHQFRLALDTDTVGSYHTGGADGYSDYDSPEDNYYLEGDEDTEYVSYKKLGKIDPTKTIDAQADVALKYKSYNDLNSEFRKLGYTTVELGNTTNYTYDPMYTLENTYYDPGMLNSALWVWRWDREPYATATNLMVLAEIEFEDNPSTSDTPGFTEGDDTTDGGAHLTGLTRDDSDPGTATQSGPRTVYLGQNNIFYLKLENLLKSKLAILNSVMLSGGNAGFQILHGQWDRHTRWDDDQNHNTGEVHLDKVAWNEGSKLWFAKVEWQDEDAHIVKMEKATDDAGNVLTDTLGNEITRVALKETVLLKSNDDIVNYLDLIPAEISGGDGQCLIAPHQDWMGSEYRYYLAPEKAGSDDDAPEMDRNMAVEISYNHLVALIHKIIGPVDVYRDGKMYYSVPIPHRLSSFGPDNASRWGTFGAFSVVRNNWYNIIVEQFTKIGTPVDDAAQPIVPVMDVKRSYINMGIKLKEWHTVVEDNIPMM